jgi:hypothetical protein
MIFNIHRERKLFQFLSKNDDAQVYTRLNHIPHMNFVYLLEPSAEWLSVKFENGTYPAVRCDAHIIELENRSLLFFD